MYLRAEKNSSQPKRQLENSNRDPDIMVPLFVMIYGFSVRELERLHGIRNVYSLGSNVGDQDKLAHFAEAYSET